MKRNSTHLLKRAAKCLDAGASAKRLAGMESELALARQELTRLHYSISHDLRAPLRAILGFGCMLQEEYGDKLDATGQRFLRVVTDNANRMGEMIQAMAALSHLAGVPLQAGEVDMESLVRDLIESRHFESTEPQLQIHLGALPPARGDATLLAQAWAELLDNAVKFTRAVGSPQIQISGRVEDQDWCYRVQDNGAGFDAEYAGKLFTLFQRLHTFDEFPGLGVGLAKVDRIVRRHGGRVWAEGTLAAGATFQFTLPRPETS